MNAEWHRMTEREAAQTILDLSRRLEQQTLVAECFQMEAQAWMARCRELEATQNVDDMYGLIEAANEAARRLDR